MKKINYKGLMGVESWHQVEKEVLEGARWKELDRKAMKVTKPLNVTQGVQELQA